MTPAKIPAAARRLLGANNAALSAALGAVLALPAEAAAAATEPPTRAQPCTGARGGIEHPDLGTVRSRDPACRRTVWLGVDVGGVVIPGRLGLFDRTVWTIRTGPAWSVRLARRFSVGGRHGMSWYDSANVRLRVHDHQVELAAHLVAPAKPRMHDRLVVGVETHAVLQSKVDGIEFRLGGVRDIVAYVGYGIDHDVAARWRIGWHAHYRHAWVFRDTQRQLRAGIRVAFSPEPAHRLVASALGFVVDRHPEQAGRPMPRRGVYGQFGLEYGWMSRHGVGPYLAGRYATGFLTGEAPVYELRSESLSANYFDATAGVRVVWK